MTWNLFHGRDFPPDPKLLSWRSRLLRITERGATHAQVNRPLRAEFAALIAAANWDVALFQESPPSWSTTLAGEAGAAAHRALTSRNSLGAIRALAGRLNPDLIASNEGGSNLTLVRGEILERHELELCPGPHPERRVMALTRALPAATGSEVWIANLHASAGRSLRADAEQEVLRAAEHACRLAGDSPLILGGDLNLRPSETEIFGRLRDGFELAPPTAPGSLDHLLVRGLALIEPPTPWPPARREISDRGLAVRLSDHAPVEAIFDLVGDSVQAAARRPRG